MSGTGLDSWTRWPPAALIVSAAARRVCAASSVTIVPPRSEYSFHERCDASGRGLVAPGSTARCAMTAPVA